MQLLSNLEQSPFLTAGNKGNTGATGAVPDQHQLITPAHATFIVEPNAAYNNGYWYRRLFNETKDPLMIQANRFTYGLRFTVQGEHFPWTRAVEFELEQAVGGVTFNMAWQGRPGKFWRYFDYTAKVWESSKIPCLFAPGVEQHVFADFSRHDHLLVHDHLNIDGVSYLVDTPHTGLQTGQRDKLNVAFQLDCQGLVAGKLPPPASADVHNLNVKYGVL